MTTRISDEVRNAMVAAAGALVNGGTIEIRTGAQPATAGAAATGTLLATLTIGATAFGAPSSGTATANTITGDAVADASGTAGWFRAKTSGGAGRIDGSITAAGGGGDMILSAVAIIAGGTVDVTSWTITQPAG